MPCFPPPTGASLNEPSKHPDWMMLAYSLGLSDEQRGALKARDSKCPPLWLAVQLGACDAAAALLAAGADLAPPSCDWQAPRGAQSAWGALTVLAAAESAAAGTPGPAAASESVPEAVQRMATLLLEARPLSGPSMVACHKAAIELAFPRDPPRPGGYALPRERAPACPWLLDRLLQLHSSGAVFMAETAAPSVEALLTHLLRNHSADRAGSTAGLDALVVQWLRIPAAQRLGSRSLASLGRLICQRDLTAVALPALLQLKAVRQALREDAQRLLLDSDSERLSDGAHSLVAAAAATGQAQALDAVLAAGGAVTLQALSAVISRSGVWLNSWLDAERSLSALRLLLSRHVPPVPAAVPDTGSAILACPIYALLDAYDYDEGEVSAAAPGACPAGVGRHASTCKRAAISHVSFMPSPALHISPLPSTCPAADVRVLERAGGHGR